MVGTPTFDAMHSFLDTTGRHGNLFLSDSDEVALLEGLRHKAAKLMGCSQHQLAIVSSASEMLGQLPMILLGNDNRRNRNSRAPVAVDRIVAVSTDFPALTRPWLKYVEDHGHSSEMVFVDDRPDQDLTEQLIEALHDNNTNNDSDKSTKTSVVAASYVQYGTGSKVDVPRLREATHRTGARLVLDATQAAGILPIHAQEWRADVVVSSGYKWLGGHGGVAIAALSEEFLQECGLPPLPGWMGTPDPFAFEATKLPVAPDARRFTQSTMSYVSVVGLEASLRDLLPLLEEGSPERHAFHLAGELVEGLESRQSPWRPFRSALKSSSSVSAAAPHIVSLGCRKRDEHKTETEKDEFVVSTVEALRNNNVFCGVRNGRIRVSLAPYNNSNDVAALLSVLAPTP